MKSHRSLLLLMGSCVLSMFAWTSDVHALSMTVSDGTNTTTFGFTSVATGTAGCLTGYSCYGVAGWTSGANGTIRIGDPTWLAVTAGSAGFVAGPILSVKDTATSAVFGINGGVFQGFSTGAGTLTISLENTFTALTSGTRPFGLIESGNFLQPGGDVRGDSLTMRGTVDGTDYAQISKTASGSTALTSQPYSLNLSPTVNVATTLAGGTNIKYTWTYNYTNSGSATSKFSDPAGGIGNCDVPSRNPGCKSTKGGSAVGLFENAGEYNALSQEICGSGGCTATDNTVPEPSSILLLGLGMVMGGFVVSRLRKNKDTGDTLVGA